MATVTERFSNRWAVIAASLGMAIGTGNIWRFPRIAAKNGGGAFLITWLIFLFSWSVPLLMLEYALGKSERRSPIGAFARVLGPGKAWMGGFVVLCTSMIMAYYSVMSGWCIRYAFASILQGSDLLRDGKAFWDGFIHSSQPLFFHLAALILCGFIVSRGIQNGIERINRIFVPSLFVLLIVLAFRAVTLPGGMKGVAFLGHIDLSSLLDHRVWLEALSQSAWSTGAGWGLILSYAAYMREGEDITLNTFIAGLGNNSASLLAALMIIPAVFALLPADRANQVLQEGNVGLTFLVLPDLFRQMPGGAIVMILFFVALSIAALSSLIAMVELGVSALTDIGLTRKWAVAGVILFGGIAGAPSALSLRVFENQDWVWGLGLILSGGLFILLMWIRGVGSIAGLVRSNRGNDLHIHDRVWRVWYGILPIQWIVLISWWIYLAVRVYDPKGWWIPWHTYSLGTCLAQWALLCAVLLALNGFFARRVSRE